MTVPEGKVFVLTFAFTDSSGALWELRKNGEDDSLPIRSNMAASIYGVLDGVSWREHFPIQFAFLPGDTLQLAGSNNAEVHVFGYWAEHSP